MPDRSASTAGDPLGAWMRGLSALYPPADAEAWDQVGLHVGDPTRDTVTGVLVALDVTEAVLDEADDLGADLLVVHHPLLFSPLRRLTPETASGRLALRAARQGCAILAAHTNVDKAADGTSHPAAAVLGLVDRRPIQPLPPPGRVKVITFVPTEHTDVVIDAMAAAGAGVIGDYTGCAFTTAGSGRFEPGDNADPHIGTRGQTEHVVEDRIEMEAPRDRVTHVLAALRQSHPYEQVAVDVVPLLDVGPLGASRGLGLIGRLPEPRSLAEVASALADGLPSPHLRLAAVDDDPTHEVTTVAICGGAGDSFIGSVIGADGRPTVDLFVTGDLKHHPTLDALTMGLSLIDAGHFATENPAMDDVATHLRAQAATMGLTAPVHRSTLATDPWTDWNRTT